MDFFISYNAEYFRVLSGVILENRQAIASTKDKTGAEVQAYIEEQIDLVDASVIPYIMEITTGNLAAFFSLKVTAGVASVFQLFIRGNFADFQGAITENISIFINNGDWRIDLL